MSAHTPGPWEVRLTAGSDEHRQWVDGIYSGDELVVDNDHWHLRNADARLIAAAPEMLDALRQFVYSMEHDDKAEIQNALHSACEAITKAEGRES